jgi:hypothetical protein
MDDRRQRYEDSNQQNWRGRNQPHVKANRTSRLLRGRRSSQIIAPEIAKPTARSAIVISGPILRCYIGVGPREPIMPVQQSTSRNLLSNVEIELR